MRPDLWGKLIVVLQNYPKGNRTMVHVYSYVQYVRAWKIRSMGAPSQQNAKAMYVTRFREWLGIECVRSHAKLKADRFTEALAAAKNPPGGVKQAAERRKETAAAARLRRARYHAFHSGARTVATGFDVVSLLEDVFAVWKNEWHFSMADRANDLEWLESRLSVVKRFPEWDQKEFAVYEMLLADALKKQTRIFQLIQQRAEEFGEEWADKNIDPTEINNLLRVGKRVVRTLMSGLWRRMSEQICGLSARRLKREILERHGVTRGAFNDVESASMGSVR